MNIWFDITKNKYTSKNTQFTFFLIHLTIIDKRRDINIQNEKKALSPAKVQPKEVAILKYH